MAIAALCCAVAAIGCAWSDSTHSLCWQVDELVNGAARCRSILRDRGRTGCCRFNPQCDVERTATITVAYRLDGERWADSVRVIDVSAGDTAEFAARSSSVNFRPPP